MTITIKYEERDRITSKGNDGTCSVKVGEQEYEGLIVGISTNGTYTIQSLDEVASPVEEKPILKKADPLQQVEDGFLT